MELAASLPRGSVPIPLQTTPVPPPMPAPSALPLRRTSTLLPLPPEVGVPHDVMILSLPGGSRPVLASIFGVVQPVEAILDYQLLLALCRFCFSYLFYLDVIP